MNNTSKPVERGPEPATPTPWFALNWGGSIALGSEADSDEPVILEAPPSEDVKRDWQNAVSVANRMSNWDALCDEHDELVKRNAAQLIIAAAARADRDEWKRKAIQSNREAWENMQRADTAEVERDDLRAKLKALVETLPKCDRQCGSTATEVVYEYEGAPAAKWCTECVDINKPWGHVSEDGWRALRDAIAIVAPEDR